MDFSYCQLNYIDRQTIGRCYCWNNIIKLFFGITDNTIYAAKPFIFEFINYHYYKGKKMEQVERRRAQRTVLQSAVIELYSQKKPEKVEQRGKICDISRVGTKFSSMRPYSKESIISLDLLLPNFVPFTTVSGRVVRCETKTADEFYTAVEFEDDIYKQSLIEHYITVMKAWNSI